MIYRFMHLFSVSDVLKWPNILSLLRITLIPIFLICAFWGHFDWALGIFVVAGISDALDGFLARYLNQQTFLGQVLDPIADKLLIFSSFLTLSISGRGYEPIPFWLMICVIGRDVGIVCIASLIYMRTGFSNFKPSISGKLSTVIQISYVALFLSIQLWSRCVPLLSAMGVITWIGTAVSAIQYMYIVRVGLLHYHPNSEGFNNSI